MWWQKKTKWRRIAELFDLKNWAIGEARQLTSGKQMLCVLRTESGFFAILDKCAHAGASLSQGKIIDDYIVECPLHRFTFDIKTGLNTSGEGFYAPCVVLEEKDDGLYAQYKGYF